MRPVLHRDKARQNGNSFADATIGDVITFGVLFNDLFMRELGKDIVINIPLLYFDNMHGNG